MTANFMQRTLAARALTRKKLLSQGSKVIPPLPCRSYAFSAKGAIHREPLATPQDSRKPKMRALKARFIRALSRAFSARPLCNLKSWGVAPGCHESALSAPTDNERARRSCPLSLMGSGALLRVVIVHDETRMDDARYPTEQRQNDA